MCLCHAGILGLGECCKIIWAHKQPCFTNPRDEGKDLRVKAADQCSPGKKAIKQSSGDKSSSNTDLFLSLSKREALELAGTEAHSFSKFHEVSGRVSSRTENEDNGTKLCTLFKYRLKADDWRHDILLPHDTWHVLGHCTVDAVDTETPQQHQPLEPAQFTVWHRELCRLRHVQIKPLQNLITHCYYEWMKRTATHRWNHNTAHVL